MEAQIAALRSEIAGLEQFKYVGPWAHKSYKAGNFVSMGGQIYHANSDTGSRRALTALGRWLARADATDATDATQLCRSSRPIVWATPNNDEPPMMPSPAEVRFALDRELLALARDGTVPQVHRHSFRRRRE